MIRNLWKATLPIAAAVGLLATTAGTANADTKVSSPNEAYVEQYTANGGAVAYVFLTPPSPTTGNQKVTGATAHGWFYDYTGDYTMDAWLERSTDGGASWHLLSVKHALTGDDDAAGTDDYYDGPGYLARACFQFTSWSGAAVHCSPAL